MQTLHSKYHVALQHYTVIKDIRNILDGLEACDRSRMLNGVFRTLYSGNFSRIFWNILIPTRVRQCSIKRTGDVYSRNNPEIWPFAIREYSSIVSVRAIIRTSCYFGGNVLMECSNKEPSIFVGSLGCFALRITLVYR